MSLSNLLHRRPIRTSAAATPPLDPARRRATRRAAQAVVERMESRVFLSGTDTGNGWTATAQTAGVDVTISGALVLGHIPLIVNAPYSNNDPIRIAFQRNSGANDFFGLDLTAANNTGRTWRGFNFIIEDADSEPVTSASAHPVNAHLHTGATARQDEFAGYRLVPNPSTTTPSPLKILQFFGTSSSSYTASGEVFEADGGAAINTGFRLHQPSTGTGNTTPNSFILTLAPEVLAPDRFEPNNSTGAATSFGTLGNRVESGLNIHEPGDGDFYKFTAAASGSTAIDVLFRHADGDVDVDILDANGNFLGGSFGTIDNEHVTFAVSAGQSYYVRVYGFAGSINTYDLRIDAPDPSSISGFTLVNATSNLDIDSIQENESFNLALLSSRNLNIRANAGSGPIGSVVFFLDGVKVGTQNEAPFALFGDDNHGDYYNGSFAVGDHTLTATPFSQDNGIGEAGQSHTIHFNITDRRITEFVLVDSETNSDIGPISSGATLNLTDYQRRRLNIRAVTDGSPVGSVRFRLDANSSFATENAAPFALFGDTAGDYYNGTLSAGSHTVRATPYQSANAGGPAGIARQITFSVNIVPRPTNPAVENPPVQPAVPTSPVIPIKKQKLIDDLLT